MNPELFVSAGFAAIVSAGLTFWIARRKSSGSVATSDAEVVFQASQSFQASMIAEMDKLRGVTVQLVTDYKTLEQRNLECERQAEELRRRLLRIEVEADAAKLIVAAKAEADKIRAEAQVARQEFMNELWSATKSVKDAKDAVTETTQGTKDVVVEEAQATRDVVVEEGQTTRDELGGGGDE